MGEKKPFDMGVEEKLFVMSRNPLDKFGPEIEAFLKIIIWNFSTRAR